MAGDAVVTVALAGSLFFSINPHAARSKVALSLALTMAPFAVVAPFLGPAIDRSRGGRRLMMVGSAAGRALAALWMAAVIKSLWLFPAALVLLILSKAHAVAKASLVPAAVSAPEDFVEANGKLAMLAALVGVAAAAPAAGVLRLLGAKWVLRMAMVLYSAGTVAAARCRPAHSPEPPPPEPQGALTGSRGVALAASAMAVLRGVVGFLTFVVAFDFKRSHTPTWWYGLVISASLFGIFVGSALGPALRRLLVEERILTGSLCVVTLAGVLVGRFSSRPAMAALGFAVGLGAGCGRLAFDAIVQRDGVAALRGRSFARFEATFQLVWVAAALVPVVVPIPTRVASFLLAISTALAALAYVGGRRSARRAA